MMMKFFLLGLGLVSICAVSGCGPAREIDKKPNVLLIVADDLGYSDIRSFGGEIATPALDSLASEGLQLTGFHVLPICSPTRSVLLSGMDNHRAGIGSMGELKTSAMEGNPGYAGYLNFEVAALPEVLKAGGYHTYMAGKWHLGSDEETSPHARGFEETFILTSAGGSHWSDRKPLWPQQSTVYRRNGKTVESLPDDFYSTQYYTDMLLQFIEQDRGDGVPFFAYLSYSAPHDPLHAPREYIEKYKGTYDEGWDVLREDRLRRLKELEIIPEDARPFPRLPFVKAWKEMLSEEQQVAARNMEVYAAMIDYMDEQIKRVFDYLKEVGEYDNTMIIFFSDNGANGARATIYPGQTAEYLDSFDNALENRGLANSFVSNGPGWARASMTPGRMFKAFPAEGGIRSPFLVKLPGPMDGAGTMNHSFVHVRDIMPSILDFAHVAHTEDFEGRKVRPLQGQSVLDLFAGGVESPYEGASRVGYEFFGQKAYISGDWKVLNMSPPFGTGNWELFSLRNDPGELNDRSHELPEKVVEMIALWEQYAEDNGVLDIALDLSGLE